MGRVAACLMIGAALACTALHSQLGRTRGQATAARRRLFGKTCGVEWKQGVGAGGAVELDIFVLPEV